MLVLLKIPVFCEQSKTVKIFRQSSYQTTLVLIMLISWLFMLVSSTCVMPMPKQMPVANAMPAGCSDAAHHHDNVVAQVKQPTQDCVLKACPDSQPNPTFNFKTDKPDIPVFILCLTWLIVFFFSPRRLQVIPYRHSPPFADPIPIRYRFCTLLN